ncbi:GGDEF domain-containing protein [Mitsuaria sp. GD03876]|uniref:GGDEF domain-containing protein n=1 Tax=Mitsuaria sp. GD03876 TaxID=2975399 RepID=UPI00244D540C|nr:GGDEF domain-containing protein [Mitsuaria sp. GD03876]MDH0867441.1 GGDEF domain-containing protein [Mitsuaria sp. GD03876]
MTHKAIHLSVGARSLLALFALGLLLVALSTGWELRETTQRRAAEADAELSAIPLLYAGPLAYSLHQRPQQPEALHGLLHHILARHNLRRVELTTPDGAQFRALSDDDSEPGRSAAFSLAETGELRLQAAAATLGDTLRRDPLLRSTLIHLTLATVLGLAAALVMDRWLLRQLRQLSEQASRFDPTLPPQAPTWFDAGEPRPRELLQLEQAFDHVRTSLGDELHREQSRGRELQEEIARQHRALQQAERSLEAKRRELASMERHDALTGIANRREFDAALRREFKRAQRDQGRLALAILDVDFLKPYNDRHGRAAGDEVLRRLARLLAEHFQRDTDLVARLGGEEFAVLLPGFDAESAQGLMEALREAWRALAMPHGALPDDAPGEGIVTISAGLAASQPGHPYLSAQALMQAADEALYLAKHMGRDRLCLAS